MKCIHFKKNATGNKSIPIIKNVFLRVRKSFMQSMGKLKVNK